MAIKQRALRDATTRANRVFIAKTLNEALSNNQQTAFLCHSHKDKELVNGLQILLKENGWNLYIDWLDEELPASPDKNTASKVKNKIGQSDWFLFLATANSTGSRWCPWEIGYADAVKKHEKIVVIPTEDDSGQWHGNEYLQLYRKITDASNQMTKKTGYAVFDPKSNEGGTWIENL
jgi:hypothetical protein